MKYEELVIKLKEDIPELGATFEDRIKEIADPYIQDQVKEHVEDAIAKIPVPDVPDVEKEVDKPRGGFKSFGEQLSAIHKARVFGQLDERLIYIDSDGKKSQPDLSKKDPQDKTMTEGTDSAGGFLVFQEDRAEMFKLGLEESIVRSNGAMVIPMKSDSLAIPRIDETSHATHLRGGIYGKWTEEAGTMQAAEPKWGEVQLNAHEYSGYTVASDRLLADSAIGLEAFLIESFGEAWGYLQDDAFISGDGSGKPLGVTQANALIGVTRQANNYVRFVDIANIWARVLPSSRKRGVWLVNHEALPELIKMNAENAAAAATAGSVIWINPNQGAANQIPGTILGRPYFETEKVPGLGSASDFGFYDFGYYLIGDRQGLTVDASKHVYFLTNKTAWRFLFRVDGQPWIQSDLTPRNGTNTLSPFVALSSTS